MKTIHALTLGLALATSGLPVAAQDAAHEHPQATPAAAPATKSAPPAHAGQPAPGKAMSGMGCDPEMHEKMMKRMERMEAMMEKMHGAHAAKDAPQAKPASEGEHDEHH